MQMRVLAVGAHPDDMEYQCCGTLAKYALRGDTVVMAIATNGEVGSPTLPKKEIAAIREGEARASADVIGAELIWMDYPDEFLFNNEQTRLRFIDLVRQARPDIIITTYLHDYHPDHTTTGQIMWDTKVMVTVPNIKTEHPPCDKIPALYFMDTIAGIDFIPEEYVDITETFELKKKMLAKHESQTLWAQKQYQMDLLEHMEIASRFRGLQAGVKYAEGFRMASTWPRSPMHRWLP
jgi:LmbE family N-acetylglucosaminyl deacetylase